MKSLLFLSLLTSYLTIEFSAIILNKMYKLNFKELIGGPTFLKIHVSIEDLEKNIEMDFIPMYPTRIDNIRKLLLGQNVEGLVRLKCRVSKSIIDISQPSIIDSNILPFVKTVNESFPQYLNLYSNNCYHFIHHYYKASTEYGKI